MDKLNVIDTVNESIVINPEATNESLNYSIDRRLDQSMALVRQMLTPYSEFDYVEPIDDSLLWLLLGQLEETKGCFGVISKEIYK